MVAEELTMEMRKMRLQIDELRKEHMREITHKDHQIKGKCFLPTFSKDLSQLCTFYLTPHLLCCELVLNNENLAAEMKI